MNPRRKTNAVKIAEAQPRNKAVLNSLAVRRYRARDPEKVRERGRKLDRERYAKRRAVGGFQARWNEWRLRNIERERLRGRANFAVRVGNKFHVDHAHPVSRGGRNEVDNLQLLCIHCNTSKADSTMFEFFLRKIGGHDLVGF